MKKAEAKQLAAQEEAELAAKKPAKAKASNGKVAALSETNPGEHFLGIQHFPMYRSQQLFVEIFTQEQICHAPL